MYALYRLWLVATVTICLLGTWTRAVELDILSDASPDASMRDMLIRNPSDPSDLYPLVFRPTDEFQVVREGQKIPKGLHVRLNMQTGEKEAKLYDPSEDTDAMNAVEVFAEDAENNESSDDQLTGHERAILDEMMKASDAGSIKPPLASGGDAKVFQEYVLEITEYLRGDRGKADKDNSSALFAFEELEDLCHDIYWGLQLVKNHDFRSAMYDKITAYTSDMSLAPQAIRLLGTALQNNRAAMTIFRDYVTAREKEVGITGFFVRQAFQCFLYGSNPIKVQMVYMMSKLLQDDSFLADFISEDGLSYLVQGPHLTRADREAQRDDKDVRKFARKAADLVSDHLIGNEEARSRLVSIHEEPESKSKKKVVVVEVSEKLRQALSERWNWCRVLNTAYDRWVHFRAQSRGDEAGVSRADEAVRWNYVPVSCDGRIYDVLTGKKRDRAWVEADEIVHVEL